MLLLLPCHPFLLRGFKVHQVCLNKGHHTSISSRNKASFPNYQWSGPALSKHLHISGQDSWQRSIGRNRVFQVKVPVLAINLQVRLVNIFYSFLHQAGALQPRAIMSQTLNHLQTTREPMRLLKPHSSKQCNSSRPNNNHTTSKLCSNAHCNNRQ